MSDFKIKTHFFVCTNTKAAGESCGPKGGQELRDKLKEKFRGLPKGTVRINGSGCLGHCEEGITCVLYPEGKWFTKITPGDAEKLSDEIHTAIKKNGSSQD